LQDEGALLPRQAGRALGGDEQHGLHLPPGSFVTDADPGVQDQPLFGGERTVVHHLAVEEPRVRDDHFLVLEGAQVGRLEPHLGHVADHVADPHAVADLLPSSSTGAVVAISASSSAAAGSPARSWAAIAGRVAAASSRAPKKFKIISNQSLSH
jgi:hypothetical protein